jgi:hypothetical protein
MWLAGVETLRRKLTVRPSMGVSLKAVMGQGIGKVRSCLDSQMRTRLGRM